VHYKLDHQVQDKHDVMQPLFLVNEFYVLLHLMFDLDDSLD